MKKSDSLNPTQQFFKQVRDTVDNCKTEENSSFFTRLFRGEVDGLGRDPANNPHEGIKAIFDDSKLMGNIGYKGENPTFDAFFKLCYQVKEQYESNKIEGKQAVRMLDSVLENFEPLQNGETMKDLAVDGVINKLQENKDFKKIDLDVTKTEVSQSREARDKITQENARNIHRDKQGERSASASKNHTL